jgi:hypothetical protein
MIRISKDNDFKEVTKGVYESIFKPLGYKPVIEAKEVKVKTSASKPKVDDSLKLKNDVFDEKEESSSKRKNKRGE